MPLTQTEIHRFKERLLELKKQLSRVVRGVAEDVKNTDEVKGYSQHQADEGTDDFNRNVSLELTSKEFETLRHINRALEKIDEETYGVCDLTGDEIPIARLEAIPYATMTVKAQEKLEKGLL